MIESQDQEIDGRFVSEQILFAGSADVDFAYNSSGPNGRGGEALKYSLSWNAGSDDSHGNFTIGEGQNFTLGFELRDRDVPEDSVGWDGKSLSKKGAGTLILNGRNAYTGTTNILEGTLQIGIDNAFASTESVNVSRGAVLNFGETTRQTIRDGSGLLNNSGTIIFSGALHTLNGHYFGDNGTLSMMLGGQDHEKLTITGHASGNTNLLVNQKGIQNRLSGSNSLEGKILIDTGTSDDTAFNLSNKVVAGLNVYDLRKDSEHNWYLTSNADNGGDGNENGGDGDGNGGGNGNGTDSNSNSDLKKIRAESSSYIGNIAAANKMFATSLSERLQGQRSDYVWSYITGGRHKFNATDNQNKNKSTRYTVQIGADLLRGKMTGVDQYRLGVMAGYGHERNKTNNTLTGYSSRATIDGYNIGIYGLWEQNADTTAGWYIDGQLYWSWFKNTVHGEGLDVEKYNSKGLSAIISSGYSFEVNQWVSDSGRTNTFYIQPKASVTWED